MDCSQAGFIVSYSLAGGWRTRSIDIGCSSGDLDGSWVEPKSRGRFGGHGGRLLPRRIREAWRIGSGYCWLCELVNDRPKGTCADLPVDLQPVRP